MGDMSFPAAKVMPMHGVLRILCPAIAMLAAFLASVAFQIKAAEPDKPQTPTTTPAVSAPSLRKPGFAFMELATQRVEDYTDFFGSVADFKVTWRKPGYVQAQSGLAELTFIDPKHWGPGHPFHGKVTGNGMGVGIEIGIVVADIDKAYAAALKFKDKGWPVTTGIVMRPWGVRDFRVTAPDGYYLRFTEGR